MVRYSNNELYDRVLDVHSSSSEQTLVIEQSVVDIRFMPYFAN